MINEFDLIGEKTGVGIATDRPEMSVGPDFNKWWFRDIHSGSDAIDAAKKILECPMSLYTGELGMEVLLICSELIFRITGEKIEPKGFSWFGNDLSNGVCSFEFDKTYTTIDVHSKT